MKEIEHALEERLAQVREAQKASREPVTDADAPAVRKRVSAEFGFVIFAETVREAAHGKGVSHHAD